MTFTCKPCSTRSTHRVTKQGYYYGTVLITCPGCQNRHLITDHLAIFGEQGRTVEDILAENGELVKRGSVNEDGDVEFWDDGSSDAKGEREGPRDGGEAGGEGGVGVS